MMLKVFWYKDTIWEHLLNFTLLIIHHFFKELDCVLKTEKNIGLIFVLHFDQPSILGWSKQRKIHAIKNTNKIW